MVYATSMGKKFIFPRSLIVHTFCLKVCLIVFNNANNSPLVPGYFGTIEIISALLCVNKTNL